MTSTLSYLSASKKEHASKLMEADEKDHEGKDALSLREEEKLARQQASHNVLYLVAVNTLSAVIVFLFHLISIESLISIALSIAFTVYAYDVVEDSRTFDGSIMNWVLLSFAIITPISAVITMAFNRRDRALGHIADLRSTFLELYLSHAMWDWGQKPGDEVNSGRTQSSVDWNKHSEDLCTEITLICKELARLLTLPNSTRARHKITAWGRKEAHVTEEVATKLSHSIVARFGQLAKLCEILKREGLPPNEATRIRQWERRCLEQIEALRVIKMYRTPQALRSFARLFSIFLPPFYAPFYAQMAANLNSLGIAIAFALLTALALTALFEASTQMEDPFVPMCVLDGIDVERDLVVDFLPKLHVLQGMFHPTASDDIKQGEVGEDHSPHRRTPSIPSLASIRMFSE